MRAARYILLRLPRKSKALVGKYGKGSFFKGSLSAIISSMTYGLIPLFSIPLMQKGLNFDTVLLYRFLLACIAVAVLMKIKKVNFKVSLKEFKALTVLSLLCNTCSLFFFLSYTYLGGGVTTTVHFLYPVFVTLIMGIFFKEKISIKGFISILLAVTGVALLSLGEGIGKINFKGILFALSAAIFYAFFLVFSVKSTVKDMPVLRYTFYIQVIGVVYLLLFCLLTGSFQWFPVKDVSCVLNITLLALIPTIVSIITLVEAVRRIGSTLTSVLGAFEPITAVIIGVLVFSEPFSSMMLLGILLIILGVFGIIISQKNSHNH
ncbi:DMT family transporter [Apibacter sp.]|uniref:DMT family transporter n=1 Tax=Apibacter sp. TaxID=2023709 RepID=UPI0025D7CC84|nr:DMT family transporter [Apibacter sp.]MCT6869114.1 DMT family transporter [Apibacter sp.]